MGNSNRLPWVFTCVLLIVLAMSTSVMGYCEVSSCEKEPSCDEDFEEIYREPCTRGKTSGEMAYCCTVNSTESLLATTYGAELNEFPHMAMLAEGGQFFCGGTIYNKRHILTAAHCVVDKGVTMKARDLTIKVGRNIATVKMPSNDYKVEKIIPHKKYQEAPLIINDIALLRLTKDIEFGENVKSLEISPKGFDEMEYGDKVVIVGWGTTHTFEASDHLQKTNLALRRDDTCFGDPRVQDVPYPTDEPELSQNPPQLLCVGGHWGDILDPTAGEGDSGGPAICRGPDGYAVLCGVTSYGGGAEDGPDRSCFEHGDEEHCTPSVYAEVDYFRNWIIENGGEQDPKTFYKVKLYGEKAPASRAAHQVHITSHGGKPCGGTLIAPDTVVTAAQCVAPGKGDVRAYPGIEVNSGGKSVHVKNINILPGFERTAKRLSDKGLREKRMISSYQPNVLEKIVLSTDRYFKNDLAVLKLSEKMDVDPTALPKLPGAEDMPSYPAYELSLPRNTSRGSELIQREFNILDREECVRRMNRMDKVGLKVKIDENVLCGVEKYSGGSTCDRELGGGLICTGENGKEMLCGVQILRLCQWSIPNGFLDVRKHLDWIKKAQKSKLKDEITPEYPEGGSETPHPEPEPEDEWHPEVSAVYRPITKVEDCPPGKVFTKLRNGKYGCRFVVKRCPPGLDPVEVEPGKYQCLAKLVKVKDCPPGQIFTELGPGGRRGCRRPVTCKKTGYVFDYNRRRCYPAN